MVARNKIDSNETGLSFAEESALGELPGVNGADAVWYGLEPNSYDDFGGQLTLLARNPINSSRQRKKGSITDLDASGGFNQDFTQDNTQRILQGFMFADFRESANEIVTAVDATDYTVASITGFAAGSIVFAKNFTNVANNGRKVLSAVAAGKLSAPGLVAEAFPPANAAVQLVGIQADDADFSIDMTGGVPSLKSAGGVDFTTLGLIPGHWVYVGGDDPATRFATAGNNGFKRVKSVTAGAVLFDQSIRPMAAEAAAAGKTIELYLPGRVLKNEVEELIKRRSYHIERRLGAPDTASANRQAEYLKGAVPNELTLNVEQADKLNADLSFVATDNEQRTATEGVKAGTRVPLKESDMFNTSTDVVATRLYVNDPANVSPVPLFGYLTSLTISINNNVSPNKAIGVLGAFDVTAGIFEVSGSCEAYFATVEAVQAVRNNENAGFFAAFVKSNAGVVVDMPLIALGDGRLNVEQNEPIKLPLDLDAATAALINPETDYTLMWSFFDYLPTVARNKG